MYEAWRLDSGVITWWKVGYRGSLGAASIDETKALGRDLEDHARVEFGATLVGALANPIVGSRLVIVPALVFDRRPTVGHAGSLIDVLIAACLDLVAVTVALHPAVDVVEDLLGRAATEAQADDPADDRHEQRGGETGKKLQSRVWHGWDISGGVNHLFVESLGAAVRRVLRWR